MTSDLWKAIGVMGGIGAFVIALLVGFQSTVDTAQNLQISQVSGTQKELAQDQKLTAEALRDVAATLKIINVRGTERDQREMEERLKEAERRERLEGERKK